MRALIKWLFDFDFKIFYKLIVEIFRLNFNLVYQYFLIFYNIILSVVIVISIKIYSLLSFLSGHTEKILIAEVFFKTDNFLFLSEHDNFGNVPILVKYLDNFHNSVKYFCPKSKQITTDTREHLILISELDTFLKNLPKSYENFFLKNRFHIKT